MLQVDVFHIWAGFKPDPVCIEGRVESGSLNCSRCRVPIVSPSWFVHVLRDGCAGDDYHLFCLPLKLKQVWVRWLWMV
jgi:hypothetical protein